MTNEFFLMPEEDKWKYKGENVFDPIKYGTSFNYTSNETNFYWRDFLKLTLHPQFHSPDQPNNFRYAQHHITCIYSIDISVIQLLFSDGTSLIVLPPFLNKWLSYSIYLIFLLNDWLFMSITQSRSHDFINFTEKFYVIIVTSQEKWQECCCQEYQKV